MSPIACRNARRIHSPWELLFGIDFSCQTMGGDPRTMTAIRSEKHANQPGPKDGPGALLGKSAGLAPLLIPVPDKVLVLSKYFAYLSKTQVRKAMAWLRPRTIAARPSTAWQSNTQQETIRLIRDRIRVW